MLVRKTLADSPMTPACKRRLAQLAKQPDPEIAFSDIPPLNGSFWKNTVQSVLPSREATTRLNNNIRVVTRRSYGFCTYKAMEMVLYHNLGRLPEPESPHKFC